MILKYGYLFKFIIFTIPIKDNKDMEIYNQFHTTIIQPQNFEFETSIAPTSS
jgi:hypothetical protein